MYRKSAKNQEINIATKETNGEQMRKKNTKNKKSVTLKLWQLSTKTYDKIRYTEPERKAHIRNLRDGKKNDGKRKLLLLNKWNRKKWGDSWKTSIFFPKSVPGIIIYLIFPLDLKMILQGKLNAFPWTEAAKRCILSAGFGAPAPRQWDMYNYRSWLKWSASKTANTQISIEARRTSAFTFKISLSIKHSCFFNIDCFYLTLQLQCMQYTQEKIC